MSPMWLTSKMPTPVRTAMCSLMMPPSSEAGYSTGISHPLNSTIFGPIWRWTTLSAVFRTVGDSTADKIDLKRAVAGCRGGVTVYVNRQYFGGSDSSGIEFGV